MLDRSTQIARALALATPALLLGGAYLSQYGFDLAPCEMCWWQRYPHFAALGLALLAFALPTAARPFTGLAALAILISGGIGAFHAGVEWGWWQGLTTCSTSTFASGGDPLAAIMNAPLVRCDVAQWRFIGLSLAAWNFIVSAAATIAIAVLLLGRRRSLNARVAA